MILYFDIMINMVQCERFWIKNFDIYSKLKACAVTGYGSRLSNIAYLQPKTFLLFHNQISTTTIDDKNLNAEIAR